MHATDIHTVVQFLHVVYKTNHQKNTANYKTLQRWGRIAYNVMRAAAVVFLGSCLLFVPLNLVENMYSDQRLPLLQTFVYGLDENTGTGYAVLYGYHVSMMFLAGIGTCSVDLMLIMLVVHMVPLVELFSNMYDQLNEAVVDRVSQKSPELVEFFENTIQMHRDICQ